jgi:hypothetical protein
MTQDRASGAAAREWGIKTARALAEKLGATRPTGSSNECRLEGSRVVIKCAAPATDSVGVTFSMLDRLDAVVGAFQRDDGAFELWSMAPAVFKRHMRDTRSKSAVGRMGLVKRDVFQTKGRALGKVRL